MDLGLAELDSGLGLVKSLQHPVMALVQAPAAVDWHPHPIEIVDHDPECADRPLQDRCEGNVEVATGVRQ
jgi:hypothetical protein